MIKADFLAEKKFSVFGIEKDMQFIAQIDKIALINPGTNEYNHSSIVIFPENDDTHFTAFLPVFGNTQPIMINYSYCELKQ